jgi:hypothetical protein
MRKSSTSSKMIFRFRRYTTATTRIDDSCQSPETVQYVLPKRRIYDRSDNDGFSSCLIARRV